MDRRFFKDFWSRRSAWTFGFCLMGVLAVGSIVALDKNQQGEKTQPQTSLEQAYMEEEADLTADPEEVNDTLLSGLDEEPALIDGSLNASYAENSADMQAENAAGEMQDGTAADLADATGNSAEANSAEISEESAGVSSGTDNGSLAGTADGVSGASDSALTGASGASDSLSAEVSGAADSVLSEISGSADGVSGASDSAFSGASEAAGGSSAGASGASDSALSGVSDGSSAGAFDASDSSSAEISGETADTSASDTGGETAEAASGNIIPEADLLAANVAFDSDASTLLWPAAGTILIDYSMDGSVYFPTLDQYKYNPALIISSDTGNQVLSAARGIVESITTDEVTGLTMTVNIGNAYRLIYGQLKEVAVQQGDIVEEGAVIGYVSEPTRYYIEEGSNLYFAMTKEGEPVDPVLYLE